MRMHECILRELVVMKKLFLIAAITLPLTSQAVCFRAGYMSGFGINMKTALNDLETKASNACGSHEYGNYSQKVSEVTYSDAGENTERPIQASAMYRCCMPW